MCGGTRKAAREQAEREGLSPRVRGNRPQEANRNACCRSIPACAGEPVRGHTGVGLPQVYPRVCGGTPGLLVDDLAGEVYPRVCGGTPERAVLWRCRKGLSPRVRGNPTRAGQNSSGTGSIPACAGEPPWKWTPAPPARVYPRVCGGTSAAWTPGGRAVGLSPRVRGNPTVRIYLPLIPGSIPACAGEPARAETQFHESAVYPRVCGGTRRHEAAGREKHGLSPRVRGNLPSGGTTRA